MGRFLEFVKNVDPLMADGHRWPSLMFAYQPRRPAMSNVSVWDELDMVVL
jgi:hypothetical protein